MYIYSIKIANVIIIGHVTWVTPPLMSNGRMDTAVDARFVEVAMKMVS